jgi:flagellar basal-body rod modification protein FlgD
MENQEFVSQLAQISSVEQLQTVNSNLQMLSLYQSSINNAQAVSLIGKNIKASGDSVAYDGDGSTELSYKLDKPAAKVTITISDAKGNVVRTLELTNVSQGEQSATWDGTNMDGSPMEEGDYAYKVTAVDTSGGTVGATTYISGLVQSITFENGAPVLMVGSHKVSMGDILEVEIPR